MTITNGYCTLAEFKIDQNITSTNSSDDTVIEQKIESASREIDRMTGRRFWVDVVDATRYYTAASPEAVRVDDLVSITSLATDYGTRDYGYDIVSTAYDLLPYNAPLLAEAEPYREIRMIPYYTQYYFYTVSRGVRVVGKFGYPSIPKAIHDACLIAAAAKYHQRFGENAGTSATITAAGVVITPKFGFPDAAWNLIKSYRKSL